MLHLEQFLLVAIQASGVVVLYFMWQEMIGIRRALQKSRSLTTVTSVSTEKFGSQCPYAVWTWRGTHWELNVNSVPKGFRALSSPTFRGSFNGQRVKTECQSQ